MLKERTIGIVGIGPRGGHAFECLVVELAKKNALTGIHFLLFESTGNFGNGQVYSLDQSEANWINIHERILEIEGREAVNFGDIAIPPFPSYHEWISVNWEEASLTLTDSYPPRAKIGKYLKERFESLISALREANIVTLRTERIENLRLNNDQSITLSSSIEHYDQLNEVLLTIGHQPVKPSEEIVEWEQKTDQNTNNELFRSPYPLNNILEHELLSSNTKIAIRGFGLAAIDLIRAVANKFGAFNIEHLETQLCSYSTNYALKDLLFPYSPDGLPPVPKPLNAAVDKWFQPSEQQMSHFESAIGDRKTQREASDISFILKAFAPMAAEIFEHLPAPYNYQISEKTKIEQAVIEWLKDQSYEPPTMLPKDLSVLETLQAYVGMAVGRRAISLDYCIGQVWRHCQPSIYEELSYNVCSNNVAKEIVALDESTKRYSFGPPVESIQQLIALIKAGILNVDLVHNPDIKVTKKGWNLKKDELEHTIPIMVDSVLPSAKVDQVSSSLVKNFLTQNLIQPLDEELGIATTDKGYILSENDQELPMALLGRLAKGTVVGVDAILECLGKRPKIWAKEASRRHQQWLEKINQ